MRRPDRAASFVRNELASQGSVESLAAVRPLNRYHVVVPLLWQKCRDSQSSASTCQNEWELSSQCSQMIEYIHYTLWCQKMAKFCEMANFQVFFTMKTQTWKTANFGSEYFKNSGLWNDWISPCFLIWKRRPGKRPFLGLKFSKTQACKMAKYTGLENDHFWVWIFQKLRPEKWQIFKCILTSKNKTCKMAKFQVVFFSETFSSL